MSRVEGKMSRVEGKMSRVEGKKSRVKRKSRGSQVFQRFRLLFYLLFLLLAKIKNVL